MRRIHFYAARADMLAISAAVEAKFNLKYILQHHFFHPEHAVEEKKYYEAPIYYSAQDIPNFGKTRWPTSGHCENYIILERNVKLIPRVTEHYDYEKGWEIGTYPKGKARNFLCYTSGDYAQGVTIQAGGERDDNIILMGEMIAWSDNPTAQSIIRKYAYEMKKSFVKHHGILIGPKAFDFLRKGARLTDNILRPPESDVPL
jgi:hypothetical protein